MFDYPLFYLRDPLAFTQIDERYRHMVTHRAQELAEQSRLSDDGCPNETVLNLQSWYEHAYTSVVPFSFENAAVLMELRNSKTSWNPESLAFFGTSFGADEAPSIVAVRQLKFESGIEISRTSLIPLRFYIESKTPVPVLRIVFGVLLDRIPPEFGRGASSVAVVRVVDTPQQRIITRLARQDIAALLEEPMLD